MLSQINPKNIFVGSFKNKCFICYKIKFFVDGAKFLVLKFAHNLSTIIISEFLIRNRVEKLLDILKMF